MDQVTEQRADVEARPPGWIATLTAPAYGLMRLSRAAALLARASGLQLFALMLLCIVVEAALCVFMNLLEASFQYDRRVIPMGGRWQEDFFFEFSSIADVWYTWMARGRQNPAIDIFMGVAFGTLAGICVAMALFWPRVHRHGPLRPTLRRTQAAVLASMGFAWLLTATVFSGYLFIDQWRKLNGGGRGGDLQKEHFAVIGTLSSILLMFYVLGRAARAVSDAAFAPDLPPQCEGCGYDLTHRPDSGICPECGMSVDKSLTPGWWRKPADFDKSPTLAEMMASSIGALLVPTIFFSRLTVRTQPQRDAAFRVGHHAFIFFGTLTWICAVLSPQATLMDWDGYTGILAGSLAATIAGWVLQHAVGSIVCLVWVLRRVLPDLRWGVRVLNYETVFLWLFCIFNGGMITSFFLFDDWVGNALGTWNYATGLPSAIVAIMVPNLALIIVWFVRLFRGGRAVQWANW